VRALAGPTAQTIDAQGSLITPGFNDAHQHVRQGAHQLPNLDLSAVASLEEMRRRITDFARAHPAREWVTGRGWFYTVFPGGFPDRGMLDELVPDRPAAFDAYDMHTSWVNSAALARMRITADTADPPGGQIVRGARGEATGILKETAMVLVHRAIPPVSETDDLDLLEKAMRLAARHGLTSVQDACVPPQRFAPYDALRRQGRLPVRVRLAQAMQPGLSMADWERRLGEYEEVAFPRRGDLWVTGGILKAFLDGVIESRTASMLAPYEGATAGQPGALGHPRWETGEFTAAVTVADRRGWQVQAHAIGDGAVRTALDAFEAASAANGARDRRPRIEHIETIDPADIPRLGRLGVIASMQPYHADPAPNTLEVWARQIGPARSSHGWAWASIQRAGGRLAFGSDWPVVSLDPRLGLNMAVNRTTTSGEPAGGWLPGERLPMTAALDAYTAGSAFAEFAEAEKGSLRTGLLADLTIWDRDLLSIPAEQVMAAGVRATIIGGRVVYER
jgi:predicted amidohydrolase YtcJ